MLDKGNYRSVTMQHSLTPSFAGIIENQQQEITLDDALDDIFTGNS